MPELATYEAEYIDKKGMHEDVQVIATSIHEVFKALEAKDDFMRHHFVKKEHTIDIAVPKATHVWSIHQKVTSEDGKIDYTEENLILSNDVHEADTLMRKATITHHRENEEGDVDVETVCVADVFVAMTFSPEAIAWIEDRQVQ